MALLTGTGEGAAKVSIDREKCNACGLCVHVCKGVILHLEEHEVRIKPDELFGCIACAQCMAVCPKDCIFVEGRELNPECMIKMPLPEERASYEQLHSLLLGRRSVRDFKDKEVGQEVIDKIIDTVSTAPMGIPPSEVRVSVLKGKDKVGQFSKDMIAYMKKSAWMFKPPVVWLFRLFMSKADYKSTVSFVPPLIDFVSKKIDEGENWLLYDAPLAMYFYCSGFADPADPYIAATYAMLAAESLGLGSCMIGSVGPFLKYSKDLQAKYGIKAGAQMGLVVIFGYPKYKYSRAIKRQLREVH
ncbi:MAG: nitroreductase family protein, partial [Candidatus Saccharibacteria bacterium]